MQFMFIDNKTQNSNQELFAAISNGHEIDVEGTTKEKEKDENIIDI